MTTINVFRAEMVEDVYGDLQPGTPALWNTFDGKVGWGNPNESVEPGKNTVITNRTVYIRSTTPTGILSTDQVEIDGIRYDIDGKVAEWGDDHVGAQFAVKAAS